MSEQEPFDWWLDHASEAPQIPVQDQRVPKLEVKRLGRMSQAVLERLRQGPASNAELALLFPAGAAWRSRLSDVRLWLRNHGETVTRHDCGGGLVYYWIESC